MHTVSYDPSLFRAVFVRFGAMVLAVVLIAILRGTA